MKSLLTTNSAIRGRIARALHIAKEDPEAYRLAAVPWLRRLARGMQSRPLRRFLLKWKAEGKV